MEAEGDKLLCLQMFYDSEPLVPPEQNHSYSGGGSNVIYFSYLLFSSSKERVRGQRGTSRRETDGILEMVNGLVSWIGKVDTITSVTSSVLWKQDLRMVVKFLKSQEPYQSSFCPFLVRH